MLALFHATDVCLVNVGDDAHVGQVLGNGKQLRGIERGGHRLAFLNALRQHDTVNGTGDGGIAQVGLCLLHTLAAGSYRLAGLVIGQPGVLVVVGRNESLVKEGLISFEIGCLVVQCALCARQVGLGTVQFADEVGLVQFGNDLPLLDY